MKICKTIEEARLWCGKLRGGGKGLGFVPTMGALHKGHLSLVRAGKDSCDAVAVSIFVNPTQFGPTEDLAKYPRTFDEDCKVLESEGIDLIFAPSADEMYPTGSVTWVEVEGLSAKLDGRSRPGHFRGVSTVVAKLFHIVQADQAFFGQKDAAQVAVIRHMVRDLNLPVQIVVCPIVREADGLAMSSRNAYLDAQERKDALTLFQALVSVEKAWRAGERDTAKLIALGREGLGRNKSVRVDYLEIVNPENLDTVENAEPGALVAVAAFVGTTRLIDNVILQ